MLQLHYKHISQNVKGCLAKFAKVLKKAFFVEDFLGRENGGVRDAKNTFLSTTTYPLKPAKD